MNIKGIWYPSLICEEDRGTVSFKEIDLLNHNEIINLKQNKMSFDEFYGINRKIEIFIENANKFKWVGYVETMWLDRFNRPNLTGYIFDKNTIVKIKKKKYTGLDIRAQRRIDKNGNINKMILRDIILTKYPCFEECVINIVNKK